MTNAEQRRALGAPDISLMDPDVAAAHLLAEALPPEALPPEALPASQLPGAAPGKPLSPAAQRALAEAAERRAALDAKAADLAATPELDGRGGLDPVRYDDWEIKGLTADF